MIDIGQAVERKFPVAFKSLFGICSPLRAIQLFVLFVSDLRAHRVHQSTPARNLLERSLNKSAQHAMLERLVEIADLPELVANVALFDPVFKLPERLGSCVTCF